MFRLLSAALLALLLTATGGAQATLITLSGLKGKWSNWEGGSQVGTTRLLNGLLTETKDTTSPLLTFGGVAAIGDSQSAFEFVGSPSSLNIDLSSGTSSLFSLGNFLHHNNPILLGSNITSARLDLSFDVFLNGIKQSGSLDLAFGFLLDETLNSTLTCVYGVKNLFGCPDQVKATVLDGYDSFKMQDLDLQFAFEGFGVGGKQVSAFITAEKEISSASLLARIGLAVGLPSGSHKVPLPDSLSLSLAAFAALMLMQRRRSGAARRT